jgi:CubicO group peptidase (beta-lactamase class C family)
MRRSAVLAVIALAFAAVSAAAGLGQGLPAAKPGDVGMSEERLALLDGLMHEALGRKDFPGAVLLVAHKGRTVWRKAYGLSQWVPEDRPMSADMIFDMASVTKPVATATSIMILVERGRLRLLDKVKDHVPTSSRRGSPGRTPASGTC